MADVRFWLGYTLCLSLTSPACKPEEFDFCSNPIGTTETTHGNMGLFCFQDDFNGCVRVEFSGAERIFHAFPIPGGGPIYGELIDIGEVSCLKDVMDKPESGYADQVDIMENHGYVIQFTNNTYGRFFVDSWSGSGSTLKVNLTWQFPF